MEVVDLLKFKFVLVCALTSAKENEKSDGIPTEKLLDAIHRINLEIGFRDDNRLVTKNQAAAIKSLLRSCNNSSILSETA